MCVALNVDNKHKNLGYSYEMFVECDVDNTHEYEMSVEDVILSQSVLHQVQITPANVWAITIKSFLKMLFCFNVCYTKCR